MTRPARTGRRSSFPTKQALDKPARKTCRAGARPRCSPWGNLVITGAGISPARIIATDKETGKVVWESAFPDTPEVTFTSAPLAIKDKIIIGAANGDQGVRDWMGGIDAATGKRLWLKYTIPGPGEPGHETWKGDTNAWQTGGGAIWVTEIGRAHV